MSGALLHIFKSRYGDKRSLIGVDDSTFIIEGPSHYTRGTTDDGLEVMVDFEGGPYIERGMTIEQATGFPMKALIESVRILAHEKPNHARCEIRVKIPKTSDKQG